jgi:hypothetical protein
LVLQGGERFNCIAFPDDGAAKRFGYMFDGFDIVICGKKRDGNKRKVRATERRLTERVCSRGVTPQHGRSHA